MSRLARLVDFQVYAKPSGLAEDEQKTLNEALFSTFEPVRLWLRERATKAPFRKLAITLADEMSSARWHGNVANAIGICQVTEAVDLSRLRQSAGDHRWVLGIVVHALECVARSTGWRSDEIEAFIKATSLKQLPLFHFFESLALIDSVAGVKCVPWLSTRPGETQIGARIGVRDAIVASKAEPIYLEDSFPMAKSVIRGRDFLILDKSGRELAAVAIDSGLQH